MKTASIICAVILSGLLGLVLSQPKRDGFVILLDESYRAEIVAENADAPEFPAGQPYETVTHEELRRAVEEEENFTPDTIFQNGETVWLIDRKRGKLNRFSPREGLKPIAVFGGKLKNAQSLTFDERGSVIVAVQSESKQQSGYLVKLVN